LVCDNELNNRYEEALNKFLHGKYKKWKNVAQDTFEEWKKSWQWYEVKKNKTNLYNNIEALIDKLERHFE
jgi:hypothetical protein